MSGYGALSRGDLVPIRIGIAQIPPEEGWDQQSGYASGQLVHRLTRAILCLLFLGVSLMWAGAGAQRAIAQATGPTTLTPTAKQVVFEFGTSRGSQSKTIEVDASADVSTANLQVLSVSDLTPSEGAQSLPFGVLRGKAIPETADPTIVQLTVTVDLSKVAALKAGSYTGSLRVFGTNVTPISIPVSVSIKSGFASLAVLVLIIGLGVGYLFRLNTQVGIKMRPVLQRADRIRHQVGQLSEEPKGLKADLDQLDQAIASWQADAATAAADLIEKGLPALAQLADAIGRARAEVAVQSRTQTAYKSLQEVVDAENAKLTDALDRAWPDPASMGSEVSKLASQIALVSWILRTDPEAKKYGPALDLFGMAKFDEGEQKTKEIADSENVGSVASDLMASAAMAASLAPTTGLVSPVRPRFLRRAMRKGQIGRISKVAAVLFEWVLPIFVGVAGAAIIAVIGFQSQYLKNAIFGFGGFGDWLSLFLWGFVAGVSGKAVADYARQASGASA